MIEISKEIVWLVIDILEVSRNFDLLVDEVMYVN